MQDQHETSPEQSGKWISNAFLQMHDKLCSMESTNACHVLCSVPRINFLVTATLQQKFWVSEIFRTLPIRLPGVSEDLIKIFCRSDSASATDHEIRRLTFRAHATNNEWKDSRKAELNLKAFKILIETSHETRPISNRLQGFKACLIVKIIQCCCQTSYTNRNCRR